MARIDDMMTNSPDRRSAFHDVHSLVIIIEIPLIKYTFTVYYLCTLTVY